MIDYEGICKKKEAGESMKKMKLGTKLLVGGILVVLIPLLVVGVFAAMKSSLALGDAAKEQSALVAKSLAGMVETDMKEQLNIAKSLAAMASGSTSDLEVLGRKLDAAHKSMGDNYETLVFVDEQGVVAADSVGGKTKGINVVDREFFKSAKSGIAYIGAVVKSKATGQPITAASAPVLSETGSVVEVVAVMVMMDYLARKLLEVKMGKTGYPYMLDAAGLMIAHPKKEMILETNITTQAGMEEIAKKIMSKQNGSEFYTFPGGKKVAGFAPVGVTNWSVAATQNMDELMSHATSIRNFILIMGVIFLGITIVGVVFFARSISLPITQAVQEMHEAANQVASASHQVASASQSLAEGASEQASAIEETSSSMEEMSSMTRQNADNANQANSLMEEAKKVVGSADASMKKLTVSMKDITSASEETSKIVKTIDEIAFQTNLLALNAAVEAARAGEAGAGFAVVAEEVRNLAMRAADAARNTSVLIEGTVRRIKEGSDIVTRTNEDFMEVARSSGKVAELIGEISAASGEQALGIGQVSKAVAEMDKVVQQNAANAEESASAAEEMNAQAQQMQGITDTLSLLVGGHANSGSSGRSLPGLGRIKAGGNGKGSRMLPEKAVTGSDQSIERRKPMARREPPSIPLTAGEFRDF